MFNMYVYVRFKYTNIMCSIKHNSSLTYYTSTQCILHNIIYKQVRKAYSASVIKSRFLKYFKHWSKNMKQKKISNPLQ